MSITAFMIHALYRYVSAGIKTCSTLGALVLSSCVLAQPTDLIISEYVEGSSSNKYIELYNGTGAAINLGNYQLHLFANGSSTVTGSTALTGSLATGAAIVYRNTSATVYTGTSIVSNAVNFNGDDAIALYKVSTASYVDIFGQIGCDPGTQWNAPGLSTLNRSLRRKPNICDGVSISLPAAPCNTGTFATLSSEWDNYAMDDVSGLGSHTMTCGPTVNFDVATGSDVESAGTVVISMDLFPAATGAGTVTIAVTNGAGVSYGPAGDYTTTPAVSGGSITVPVALGATSITFSLNIIDDTETESDEEITFTISGATGGISLGADLTHVFTIVDNDATPTVNFSTLSIAVLENAGVQNFQLNIDPAAPTSGNVTIQVSDGPGVVYGVGNDYWTTPPVIGGVITIPVALGATSVSFSATIVNDVIPEDTEVISFTIIGVPVGFVIGSSAHSELIIGDNDTPPTVLLPGDLIIVGLSASSFGCGPASGAPDDQVSFFCTKPIVPGTEIIITDNAYSRCTPGLWGDNEGIVRITRTGIAIPAGKVITLTIANTAGPGNVIGLAPDAAWSCTSLNSFTTVNMNAGGDQLFFAQGGTWTNPPGAHDATYDGTILYGFTTNPTFPWSSLCTSNQRSDLPPGIECFSMAPTSATDHNKYTGPTTAATKRDWIIRVDDINNWTTAATCTDYASVGYNWVSSPTLPIIPGNGVPGRWRGATNTDWFECKNWDDARIPTATTDVVIDPVHATRNCFIGVTPNAAATCASLEQTSGGVARSLTIDNSSTLQVNGPFKVERTAGTDLLATTVLANCGLFASSVELKAPAANLALLRAEQAGSRVVIENDLMLAEGAWLDLQPPSGLGGLLELGGDFINLNSEAAFHESNSTVRFNGNGDQTISTSTGAEVFADLEVVKTGGDLVLASTVQVKGVLNLSNGLVQSSAASLLSLRAGSSVINASDASFVSGPMEKIGNTPIVFPVGKGSLLRPCSLENISGGPANAFTAEYFTGNPRVLFNNVLEPTLHHVSACEYWMIDRSNGLPNATVSLSWREPYSCGVSELSSLRVARWDGSMWLDRGNGGATGTLMDGSVPTAAVQTLFSPWTLASISSENPLPITLLVFDAQAAGDVVDLYWATASEKDNEHFMVERSADGSTFFPLLRTPGAGTSTVTLEYAAVDDAPLQGLSYYRLRQTDFDGSSSLSNVVSVRMNKLSGAPLSVHVGDGSLLAFHSFEPGSQYSVLDMTGRLVSSGSTEEDGRLQLSVASLPAAAYILRLENGQRSESVRFIR